MALVTTDCMVEGVHFTRDTAPARLVGRKALTVNLSDVAAMGGIGRYATVSLLLPPDVTLGWVDALYDGLLERAAEAGVAIIGGNLARSREGIVVDVTMLGDAGRLLLRSGARPGDLVVVTGTLGGAAEGVRLLQEGARLDDGRPARGDRPVDGVLVGGGALRACARSSTRGPRSPSRARSRSAASRTPGWTCRTGSRPTSSTCAPRAASRRSWTRRRCRSTRRRRGSRARAGATRSSWRSTAARTTSCCSRWHRTSSARCASWRGCSARRSPPWAPSSRERPQCGCTRPRARRRSLPRGHDHFRALGG